jgi:hypothetical protein
MRLTLAELVGLLIDGCDESVLIGRLVELEDGVHSDIDGEDSEVVVDLGRIVSVNGWRIA